MGLSWQQGPLSPGAIVRFLVPGVVFRCSATALLTDPARDFR
jgi:hypothetical protein